MTITIKCKCGRERTIDVSVSRRDKELVSNNTGIDWVEKYEGVEIYCECGEQGII